MKLSKLNSLCYYRFLIMVEDARSRGLLQERTFNALKSVIPQQEFQDALSVRDNAHALQGLDRAMEILTLPQQRNLAVHVLNGISQRLPDQPWNPATQVTALAVFSRINFRDMQPETVAKLSDRYARDVHASLIAEGNSS